MTTRRATASNGTTALWSKAGWINDPSRLDAIMGRAMRTFMDRLIGITFSKSVMEGPLDVVRIELDRVRNADTEKARDVIAEDCVLARGIFAMDIRILPRFATRMGNRMGPYDKGPAEPEAINAVRQRLKKGDYDGMVFHDNLFGRTIHVVEKERGRYVLRAVTPTKRIVERLRAGPEMIEYLDKGWWAV